MAKKKKTTKKKATKKTTRKKTAKKKTTRKKKVPEPLIFSAEPPPDTLPAREDERPEYSP